MKVVKATLHGGIELFIPFDELNKFSTHVADIDKLEGVELTEKDYYKIPASNQHRIFFKEDLKAEETLK